MNQSTLDQLHDLLTPFVKEHELLRDSVRPEDVETLLSGAKAFQVEKKLLDYVKAHPDGPFWDFLDVLPEGVPPGQEDILDDDGEND